ncbi:predicted protein [Naegleria gruberi]|uniref:Predicted protein n=1 Tax=Naegleria gruberi TaxID=5762 RepID=D2VN26_NAEGR|nr:uncharacterized protein NAEGRDRAFT_80604 [Naegleria gruberi]EFC41847.1 predicted protein [Naegleria gruberi]|eukprot:XP_002674591.1 predicted protein [Naegleria gruberi strain NEG-M]
MLPQTNSDDDSLIDDDQLASIYEAIYPSNQINVVDNNNNQSVLIDDIMIVDPSSESTFRIYLNEFIFTEYEYVEVTRNYENQKEYRKTNVNACGWLKKNTKNSTPYLDNKTYQIPLDPNGDYFIEKLLLVQISPGKIPKRYSLERTIPEFRVDASGNRYIGAKLRKIKAFNANQETVNRILRISKHIQDKLIQEWPENLREDVFLLPLVSSSTGSSDISLFNGIPYLDVLEQFFSNNSLLIQDAEFEKRLKNPKGLLVRCEQTFEYSILVSPVGHYQGKLLGRKLTKELVKCFISNPHLISAKNADIEIDPSYVSFPRYGLELVEQLREQFYMELDVLIQMNHYQKMLDFYIIKFPGYRFLKDPLLIRVAHTFPSYAHKMNFGRGHYERLEFMGDSVVNLTACVELIKSCRNDDSKKGDWNAGFTVLIANDSITREAEKLQISEHFLNSSDKFSKKAQSNVIESIIGALYMAEGIRGARSFAKELLIPTSIDFKCLKKFSSSFPSVSNEGEQWKRDVEHMKLFIGQDIIEKLQDILHYRFRDVGLIQEALISCSYNNTFMDLRNVPMTEKIQKFLKKRNDSKIVGLYHLYNNEQLKLLGSALLKFMVTEFVYKRFTEAQPSKLTLLAHQIISKQGKVFSAIHEKFRFDQFLMKTDIDADYSEIQQSYDCFTALLGAIFMDQDCLFYKFEFATISNTYTEELANSTDPCSSYFLKRHDVTPDKFFYSFLFPYIEQFELSPYTIEPPKKHTLQHLIQVNHKSVPSYVKNQDVSQEFCVTIMVNGQEFSKGVSSKSFAEAEEQAIEMGLKMF